MWRAESTHAERDAAPKHGQVQLVDDEGLLAMPGQLPDHVYSGDAGNRQRIKVRPGTLRNAMSAGLAIVLLKLTFGLIIVLVLTGHLESMLSTLRTMFEPAKAEAITSQPVVDSALRPSNMSAGGQRSTQSPGIRRGDEQHPR